MNDIAAHRQRLAERLARIDADRLKVSEELAELEAAERVLTRLSPMKAAPKRRPGRPRKTKATKSAQPAMKRATARVVGRRAGATKLLLGDATLRAVKALGKEVSAGQIRGYLARKFGMQVESHHLGRALQRHRVGGRLMQHNERWSMGNTANGASAAAQ